jgi:hypothetical protein
VATTVTGAVGDRHKASLRTTQMCSPEPEGLIAAVMACDPMWTTIDRTVGSTVPITKLSGPKDVRHKRIPRPAWHPPRLMPLLVPHATIVTPLKTPDGTRHSHAPKLEERPVDEAGKLAEMYGMCALSSARIWAGGSYGV